MALPCGERRALARIEKSMRPDRVTGDFAMLGHLAGSDSMPVAEQIAYVTEAAHARRWSRPLGALAVLVTVFAIPGWLALSTGRACANLPAAVRMSPPGKAGRWRVRRGSVAGCGQGSPQTVETSS